MWGAAIFQAVHHCTTLAAACHPKLGYSGDVRVDMPLAGLGWLLVRRSIFGAEEELFGDSRPGVLPFEAAPEHNGVLLPATDADAAKDRASCADAAVLPGWREPQGAWMC